jgi:parallel beta-helix repeat protein
MKHRYLLLAIALLSACGGGGGGSTTTTTVHAGESIQDAIDRAPTHSTIVVEPGVYHESPGGPSALVISKDGIRLVGRSTAGHPVVLENAGGQDNGIVVAPSDSAVISTQDEHPGEHPPCGENGNVIHDFALNGFTVRGYDQFGVYLACVDGFALEHNATDADQLYGLFPVRSRNGTLRNNEAQNTLLDAALYVGQSDHVTVSGNTTHGNLLGLEIENSRDVTATDNEVYNNTLGIIADVMPGLQKMDQTNVTIAHNNVHDNNLPNTTTEGETELTPPGTGMVILGGSRITVRDNTVSNNGFAGIIVISYCTGLSPCTDLDIDPNPEHVHVLDNAVSDNGNSPPDDPALAAVAADLIWDTLGTDNCWAGNTPSARVTILGAGQLPVCAAAAAGSRSEP